ncbi:MAG: DUF697 domain-containing protein [Myxococcota bacterium]
MATKSSQAEAPASTPDSAQATEATGPTEATPTAAVLLTGLSRLEQANQTVQNHVYAAMGAGVLPLPVVDLVAITGVQLNMLRQLSKQYEIPFREGLARKAVISLFVGLGGVGIGGVIGFSLFKFVPVVGASLGVVSVPVISGMLTHAVGRTFIMHFEAGGTLLDFKPRVMRDYFRKEFSSAKESVSDMEKEKNKAKGIKT